MNVLKMKSKLPGHWHQDSNWCCCSILPHAALHALTGFALWVENPPVYKSDPVASLILTAAQAISCRLLHVCVRARGRMCDWDSLQQVIHCPESFSLSLSRCFWMFLVPDDRSLKMYRAEANSRLLRFSDALTDLDYLCCLHPSWTEVRNLFNSDRSIHLQNSRRELRGMSCFHRHFPSCSRQCWASGCKRSFQGAKREIFDPRIYQTVTSSRTPRQNRWKRS